jgi:hypothetical protein
MEKLNITKSEWVLSTQHFLHIEDITSQWICQLNDIKPNETEFLSDEYLEEEKRVKQVKLDNGILLADAGTTYNQTPILPSELLKQRNELLKALQLLINDIDRNDGDHINRATLVNEAKQIIKNCEQ